MKYGLRMLRSTKEIKDLCEEIPQRLYALNAQEMEHFAKKLRLVRDQLVDVAYMKAFH